MNFQEIIKYIILGIIQGIAEILPISSSGHLIIMSSFFGIEDNSIAFDIFLHVASLIAVVFFLRKQICRILYGTYRYLFKKDKEYKYPFLYFCYLCVSTIITAGIGIFLNDYIDQLDKPLVVAFFLFLNGIILMFADKMICERDITDISLENAVVIGLAQGIGLFPGISRSGMTMSGAIFQKFNKEEAAEYAFLLFIPSALGAMLLNLDGLVAVDSSLWLGYILAFAFALIFTYLSLKIFLKIIRKQKLSYFAYYCFIVSIITFIYEFTKAA